MSPSAVAGETLRPDPASPSCESINQPQPLQTWYWHLLHFATQARLSRNCLLSFQIPEALIPTTAEVFPQVFSSQWLQTLQQLRDMSNVHCSSCSQKLPDACPWHTRTELLFIYPYRFIQPTAALVGGSSCTLARVLRPSRSPATDGHGLGCQRFTGSRVMERADKS